MLATLIRQLGDFQLAEDALQDAFAEAIVAWDRDGVPQRPGAWITTAARRRAIDRLRRDRVLADRVQRLGALAEIETAASAAADDEPRAVGGDRRSPAADLHVLPSGARDARPRGADAALARRPDDGRDRARVPRRRAGDGAADRAREAQDRRRPDPVPDPARRRAARPPRAACSPSSTSSSTKAGARRRATGSCAASCAARRSASAGCCCG